jgi:hypothetical protein
VTDKELPFVETEHDGPLFTWPARTFTRCMAEASKIFLFLVNFNMLRNKAFNPVSSTLIRSYQSPQLFPHRFITTPASSRLTSRIDAHLSSSKASKKEVMPRAISRFIIHYPWSIRHTSGTRKVSMHRTVDARAIEIKWELFPSVGGDFVNATSIFFTISVEDKLTPQGMIFHCRTRKGANYRYMIECVECYTSHTERDSRSSFRGPRFDTLEPILQEAFDELLHSWGMGTEVIDFIEASSQYYNSMEYVSWLSNIKDFISQ